VVGVTNPYGRNLDFLDRSRYFFFQVAPELYSRGCVDPVPDPLLLIKSGSVVNRTRASGSVARNSDSMWIHRCASLHRNVSLGRQQLDLLVTVWC
jgi:hypothetical protein